MKLENLSVMLRTAVNASTENVLALHVRAKDLTKSQAYRIYGRSNVDRWLSERLIQISDKKIDRLKLESIAASSNRVTYLPVAERC